MLISMRRWLISIALIGSACAPTTPALSPAPTLVPTSTIVAVPTQPAPSPSAASSQALPSAGASGTPVPLPSSAFVAAGGNGVVWLFVDNPRLFRSRDRGETWGERVSPPQIINGNIAFVDDRHGWMLTGGSAATGCMAQYYGVWRTTDGAATWQKVFEDSSPASSGCK